MENYAYFVLGMLSIIFLFIVAGMVWMIIRIIKHSNSIRGIHSDSITGIYNTFNDVYQQIERNFELDNRRIDGEIDRVNIEVDSLRRYIDSRIDKLDSKLPTSKASA
jgi:hypothetical protein